MKNKSEKPPVKTNTHSTQLSLFGQTTLYKPDSKSIRLWESLSNVIFSGNKHLKRIEGRFLDSKVDIIEFENEEIEVIKHPARVERKNKNTGDREFVDAFPQRKEYVVLETLIKLAVDDREKSFYQDEDEKKHLGLMVNIYSISQAIKAHTGTARYKNAQIKEAIEILAGSQTTFISKSAKRKVGGSLISWYTYQDSSDPRQATFLINFHPLISELVKRMSFRQINYGKVIRLKRNLSSFLYKRFVHKFIQASKTNFYHFSLSSILKELPHIRKIVRKEEQIREISKALEDLKGENIVKHYELTREYGKGRGGKKTVDCKFEVYFTDEFIGEQIKSNSIVNQDYAYTDIGEAILKPVFDDYREKYPHYASAKRRYNSNLAKWQDLKSKNKKSGIVHDIFKNADKVEKSETKD